MGLWNSLKKFSRNSEERKSKKEQQTAVGENCNPTKEQIKNNKKGKLSYLWTAISIVVYLLGFALVATAWTENIGVGILALLFVLVITPIPHRKAIELAQQQRRINGRGFVALLLAIILPLVILAGGFFFFVFGGMYWR